MIIPDGNDSVVYKITNIKNGRMYIGRTTRFRQRIQRHISELNSGKHHSFIFQKDWNKFDQKYFRVSVVMKTRDEDMLIKVEKEEIDRHYDKELLYNIGKFSEYGGDLISYHPKREQIAEKIGGSVRERYSNFTDEQWQQLSESRKGKNNGMYGRTHTKEVRNTISEKLKKGYEEGLYVPYNLGKSLSDETKEKMSQKAKLRIGEKNPFYGKQHTEEAKRKISESRKGNLPTNSKKVIINGKIYSSQAQAARDLGVSPGTIRNRINSKDTKFLNYNNYD